MSIVIIGGGPAGCAAAHHLHQHGLSPILLEADEHIGGRTRSMRKEGFVLDTGAGFVTNFYPRLFKIARENNWTPLIQKMNRISGLYRHGTTANLNIGSAISFARFPFLNVVEKMKMASWTLGCTLKKSSLDLALPQTLTALDTMSIEEYAHTKLTQNIYHALIRPGIEPFWYFSCAQASAALLVGLTSQAAGASFYSLPQGIDQITHKLTENINIKTKTRVEKIHPHNNQFRVVYQNQDSSSYIDAEAVIIATTATVAQQLLHESLHLLHPQQQEFLKTQKYAANIHACFRIKTQNSPPAAGSIFPCDDKNRTLAALSFHRAKHQDYKREEELVSIYLSDVFSRSLLSKSDEHVYQTCWAQARQVCPSLPQESDPFALFRRDEAIPIHAPGRYQKAVAFQNLQKHQSIQFCGDYLATATIEGAIASGQQAATNALKKLKAL